MMLAIARRAAGRSVAAALPLRALSVAPRRSLSSAPAATIAPAIVDEAEWEATFLSETAEVLGDATHADSADALRALVKTGLLRHTDLRDRPERFFKAHRLLARHAVQHGPGFWIRFTVHYNLCFGTVLAVGSEEQVAALDDIQAAGQLGCFALTEKLAGVQSGLLVQTQATYDGASDEFVLNTPDEGASKNWISQGFTADKAVVLADLSVGGERKGPHAFLMDLRSGGELTRGVSVGDMGAKTTGNDLDNAWIRFDGVRLPRGALLNAHASVSADGVYEQTTQSISPFEMIGQRLYTGRVAVAQAALSYRRKLYEVTREYADNKPIWNALAKPGDAPPALSSIPQLKALFAEAEATAAELESFVARCEEQLVPLLADGRTPSAELSHSIATAKVKAVEASIDLCWRLKQEVGSYALMSDSGFAHLDFLNCCKFAEGDSRVLMQKMSRDTMRRAAKDPAALAATLDPAELELATALGKALGPAKGDRAAESVLWDENWTLVYGLAEATMARTMRDFMR